MLIAVGLTLVVLLTVATGYFVAQEFAYVSVDRTRLRQMADEGDAAARRALDITARLSFTLSGAQFGITVTALLVGYAGEPLIGLIARGAARGHRPSVRDEPHHRGGSGARLLDGPADGRRRARC